MSGLADLESDIYGAPPTVSTDEPQQEGSPLKITIRPSDAQIPPASVQNNNPGNIKSPTGDVVSFDSPKAGLAAMQHDLTMKISGGSPIMKERYGDNYQPTLRNVISTWAPPNENDTDNYIGFVAKNSGLDPDKPLMPDDVAKIMQPMIHMEGGQKAASYFGKLMGGLPQQADAGTIKTDAQVDQKSNPLDSLESDIYGAPSTEQKSSAVVSPTAASPFPIATSAVRAMFNIMKTAKDIPSQMLAGATDAVDLVTNNTGNETDKSVSDLRGKIQNGTATSADYKKTFLVGEGDSPGGKFLGATRMFPPFAIGASAFQNLINPELENAVSKVGMDKEDVPIAEQALMFMGGKNLPKESVAPDFINNPVAKAGAAIRDFNGTPIEENPNLPATMSKMPETGTPLLVSNRAVQQGLGAFREYQKTDGIDLNKTADTLEEMQKTNPNARAIDAMTKNEEDIPTGANIKGFARMIANSPGQGQRMLAEMGVRSRQAATRIGTLFDNTISNLPYAKVSDDAIQAKEGTAPLYQEAFQKNQNMNSPKMNQILNRPAGKIALKNAATTMQNDGALVGVSNPDLVEQAVLAGQEPTGFGIASGLKMRTLHYVKQELWDLAQKEYVPGQGYTANGSAILGQYHDLLNEMNANDATTKTKLAITDDGMKRQPVPGTGLYAQANQKYSTGARQKKALEQGTKFNDMRPEEIHAYLNDKNISNPEKGAFLSGVRDKLGDLGAPKAPGQNPINVYNKNGLLGKLQIIAGDKAPLLMKSIENEAHMATNDSLFSGSQTYANTEFGNAPATPHTLAARMAGEVPIVGGLIGYGIDKALAKMNQKLTPDSKAVAARILTSKSPSELRTLASKSGEPNK